MTTSLERRHRFAARTARLRASTIREILKVTQRPEVISFAGGLPAPELFPTHSIAESARKVMETYGQAALQYSVTEGIAPLRAWVAERLKRRRQIDCTADDVLVTGGSQQGLDLVAKVYLDPGDFVVLENPSYLGAIQCFDAYEARYLTVETDAEGIIPEALESVLRKAPVPPKFLYLCPNFQNPTGVTLAEHRREPIVRICERFDLPIFEDDPYGELRFEGRDERPLASYASDATILYAGTGSKIVAPGLRVAWLVVKDAVVRERIVPAKQATDLQTGTFAQHVFCEHVGEGTALDDHIETLRTVYGLRRTAMLAALEELMPPYVRYNKPEGGMFFWATLERDLDTEALLPEATRRNVAFVPGRAFYPHHDRRNGMRLNFSNSNEATIRTGMERLAEAMRSFVT